ncbi:CHAT domain-containing protein [Nodularia sp. UHCC 0506]|uniref:CHAT domain-containing protein n=1 Tax=Nodularia sp. UHCC 0506 TaxID=3110243 RepID=UPI002B2101D0|nr:CHAT domain-containing protein [Nodularia sp. UHCC 0506]MEA5514472.1 CHAT domain-containing protein [Nodularia sp. UHCC 0506]
MSESQLDFLLQVLQATADSKGDARVIDPLLEANQEKLDINFAQVLRSWADVTLAALEIEKTRKNTVVVIGNFSNYMQEFPRGNRANNLEIAIAGYEIVLTVFTQDRFPYEWATTQNNLGAAYSHRIQGTKSENLELAIFCYQQALQEYARDRFPNEWARTQNNLGNAYSQRIQGNKAANLETAIFYYQQALQEYTPEAFPQDYAGTAFSLGLAYKVAERFADAYNILQSAIDVLESLPSDIISSGQIKQKLAKEWHELYRCMVEVCLELKYYNQAVEYIERSKTQKLASLLTNQSLPKPHPLISFIEIQGLLDNHTAIVQWFIFDDCFRAFIITKQNQTPRIWKSTAEDLQALDNWYHRYLENYSTNQSLWINQLTAQLQKLADILHINDVLNLIPNTCKSLIFIPHRYLHLLPLHALPLTENRENYLLDKFSGGVRYAPSCQLLKFAKNREYQPQKSLLAIQYPHENRRYPNLEVEAIQGYFNSTIILEKAQVTKPALLEAIASYPDVQVVHFSGRCYFDSKNINLEKCLTLGDIFPLNLPECRLVTISACETILANYASNNDEYIGLPTAFLQAGSSSVVSSLWSVNDFATAVLMIRFYDNLHSLPVAQALREAQLWLRNATKSQFIHWMKNHSKINEQHQQTIQQYLKWYKPDDKPLNEPVNWAGFCAF